MTLKLRQRASGSSIFLLPAEALSGGGQSNGLHLETSRSSGSEQPQHALALSRRRLDLQQTPIGKRLEAVKQMMLRVHRASGHPSMTNLVSLLHGRAPG